MCPSRLFRLVFLLVIRLAVGVSSVVLSWRLVVASRFPPSRLLRLVFLRLVYRVSRGARLVCASCRGRLVSFFSPRVSFRSSARLISSSRLVVSLSWCVADRVWGVAAAMMFSCCHMVLGRWRLVFSVLRLARRGGGEEDETRRFIQLVFVCV